MARLIEPFKQFFDNSGDPLVSGKVWFYESGSSSLFKTTYADSGETIPNSNPVILAGDGRCPNVFGTGSYRAIVTDSTDVQISSKDPIGGANGVEFGADWNATQIYDASDVVRYDGKYWVSDVSGNLGNTPEDGIYWTRISFEASTENVLFGNFRVNQREVTGTVVLAAGEYGHDRFRGGSAGCTYTFATADGVTTITITVGTIEQEVEGANIQSDGYILQWGGSSQGRINGGSYGASGTVLASLVGGTNAIVEFGTGTLSLPDLRVGTSEQVSIQRPIGEEISLCERYCEKSYSQGIAPGAVTEAGSVRGSIGAAVPNADALPGARFKTTKRAAPTVVVYSVVGTVANITLSFTDRNAGAVEVADTSFSLQNQSGVTFSSGLPFRFHYLATSEL